MTAPPNLGAILNKLTNVKKLSDGWTADCPCAGHSSPKKHLSVKDAGDKALVTCFGQHSYEDICQAMGFDSLAYEKTPLPVAITPQISKVYDYKDEKGEVLFQVVRYVPKDFRQRHKNGKGEWVWNLDGVRRVLYHLPDLKEVSNETVYIVEGEKDADNLLGWAQIATTSPQGASAWKSEYADYLKGLNVVIIPDKDAAGYSYAKQVVKSLEDKAKTLGVIILPGENIKDVSDWLDAGGDVEQLPNMVQDVSVLWEQDKVKYTRKDDLITWPREAGGQTVIYQAEKLSEDRTGVHARISIMLQDLSLSWSYLNIERRDERSSLATAAHSAIKGDTSKAYGKDDLRYDLDNFCKGLWEFHLAQFVPEDLAGDENPAPLEYLLQPYILRQGGTILFAPPGRGKSYSALLWAVSVDAGCGNFWPVKQARTLFINLERSKESVRRRLSNVNKVLGLAANRPLFILNARGKSLADVLPACRKAITQRGIQFVVLDSISRAGAGDLNENQSGNKVVDALSSLCPTWLALGHTPRQSEEHVFGSIMIDAGADLCVQLSSQVKDDGTLGCGWQITKQNDTGYRQQAIYAFVFGETGLTEFRKAKPYEFPEVEGKQKESVGDIIKHYILQQESGDATAQEVAENTGQSVDYIYRILHSSTFTPTRKQGRTQYYGVADKTNTLI